MVAASGSILFHKIGEHLMKRLVLIVLLLAVSTVLLGCGETVSGVGKDVNRMGRGVSTFFFRQP